MRLAEQLGKDDSVKVDDLVLCLADDFEGEFKLCLAPLVTVRTFVRQYHPDQVEV